MGHQPQITRQLMLIVEYICYMDVCRDVAILGI